MRATLRWIKNKHIRYILGSWDYEFYRSLLAPLGLLGASANSLFSFLLSYLAGYQEYYPLRAIAAILLISFCALPKTGKLRIGHKLLIESAYFVALPIVLFYTAILNNMNTYWFASIVFCGYVYGLTSFQITSLILFPVAAFTLSAICEIQGALREQYYLAILVGYLSLILSSVIRTVMQVRYLEMLDEGVEIARIEERLKKAQEDAAAKAIARTTQRIAHDFRVPFSTLQLLLARFTAGNLSEAQASDVVGRLNTICRYVDDLIEDLLVAGDVVILKAERVDLKSLISDVWTTISGNFGVDRFELNCRFEGSTEVFVESSKVRRLFANLLKNAAVLMPETSHKLWITSKGVVKDGRTFIEVIVGNEGTYIPDDKWLSIFDEYYTAGSAKGIGLGLSICSEVVRKHGGEIRCFSSPTSGTEFIFTLPAATNQL